MYIAAQNGFAIVNFKATNVCNVVLGRYDRLDMQVAAARARTRFSRVKLSNRTCESVVTPSEGLQGLVMSHGGDCEQRQCQKDDVQLVTNTRSAGRRTACSRTDDSGLVSDQCYMAVLHVVGELIVTELQRDPDSCDATDRNSARNGHET